MQLEKLKRSRARPKQGDIFVYRINGAFGFGRVISDRIKMQTWTPLLVYLYDAFSPDKHCIPELKRSRLLTHPLFVGLTTWRERYFETIASSEIVPKDILKKHCFWDRVFSCYRNEQGKRLEGRHRARGMYTLTLTAGIEAEIVHAIEKRAVADDR